MITPSQVQIDDLPGGASCTATETAASGQTGYAATTVVVDPLADATALPNVELVNDYQYTQFEVRKVVTAGAGVVIPTSFEFEVECTFLGAPYTLPAADAAFTLAVSQEAFAHIPDKPALVAGIARVLARGGRLVFSDILSHAPLGDDDAQRLYDGMRFSQIATEADYRRWLQASGMTVVEVTDLSAEWTRILVERHAMYRSLQAQTVARLGRAPGKRGAV